MMNMVAKEIIEKRKVQIDVVDTKTACLPIYYLATNVGQKIIDGKSYQTIYDELMEEIEKTKVLVKVDTLDYLAKGGRLPKAIALMANVVSFKPVLTLKNGKIKIVKKAMGKKKSLSAFIENIKILAKDKKNYYFALAGGDDKEELEKIKESLKEEIQGAKIFKDLKIPPVFGVHLGPGSLVASLFEIE